MGMSLIPSLKVVLWAAILLKWFRNFQAKRLSSKKGRKAREKRLPCLIWKEPSSRRFLKTKVSIASLGTFCHLGKGAVRICRDGARFKPYIRCSIYSTRPTMLFRHNSICSQFLFNKSFIRVTSALSDCMCDVCVWPCSNILLCELEPPTLWNWISIFQRCWLYQKDLAQQVVVFDIKFFLCKVITQYNSQLDTYCICAWADMCLCDKPVAPSSAIWSRNTFRIPENHSQHAL